jgi:hypothetical protein
VYLVQDIEDLRRHGHAPGWRFRAEPEAGVLSLDVERPLVGVRYVISWIMPGARDHVLPAEASCPADGSPELAAVPGRP